MTEDTYIETYRQFRTAQDKYAYFILAAAGGGIALAVNQTQDMELSYSQIPLGLAVFMWGLSFFLGCRFVLIITSSLYSNLELLIVKQGAHAAVGSHPQRMAAASQGIEVALDANAKRTRRLGMWQFRTLWMGAFLYVMWHVVEMWLRTAR